eukprot:scaffold175684_cov66-Cyclotella_meneghiniana.AAC.1
MSEGGSAQQKNTDVAHKGDEDGNETTGYSSHDHSFTHNPSIVHPSTLDNTTLIDGSIALNYGESRDLLTLLHGNDKGTTNSIISTRPAVIRADDLSCGQDTNRNDDEESAFSCIGDTKDVEHSMISLANISRIGETEGTDDQDDVKSENGEKTVHVSHEATNHQSATSKLSSPSVTTTLDLPSVSAADRTLPSACSGPTPAEPSTVDDDANKN